MPIKIINGNLVFTKYEKPNHDATIQASATSKARPRRSPQYHTRSKTLFTASFTGMIIILISPVILTLVLDVFAGVPHETIDTIVSVFAAVKAIALPIFTLGLLLGGIVYVTGR